MRTVQIEVRRGDGWESLTIEGIESLRIAGAPGEDGLQLTLIGERLDSPNQVETDILDVADRHEVLLDSELPTLDGQALPLALREGD